MMGSYGTNTDSIVLDGRTLTLDEVIRVARRNHPVRMTSDPGILRKIEASCAYIDHAMELETPIYGVTTKYGGMAHEPISAGEAAAFQNSAIWAFKCGAGRTLPASSVRAALLLRANSHLKGASGIRLELIERMITFLNHGFVPRVPELGSIGASGDVVPLNYIAGALIGLDESFAVDIGGDTVGARTALKRLGLAPLRLRPKEGLAMINGTSVTTGIAINCLYDAEVLLALAVGINAFFVQGFNGTNQSFHPFIHGLKPHRGQSWSASELLGLLDGSRLVRDELHGQHDHRGDELIQDRYMLRCLPQFLGPLVDGLRTVGEQLEVESNSANDNPLVDAEHGVAYHGGNFLGEYVGIGMDQVRFYLGLLVKHLDVQIGWISSSLFSNGLADCLIGNEDHAFNLGFKGLQLCGNSIMPLVTFLGAPLVDRFPTHAEQFNQNVNSQGYGAANLARQSIELSQQYLAIALMFAVQAVDLRSKRTAGHYDARACLSPATLPLYEAMRAVVGVPPVRERPYVWNDEEQRLDDHIARIARDIADGGAIAAAVSPTLVQLWPGAGSAVPVSPASGQNGRVR